MRGPRGAAEIAIVLLALGATALPAAGAAQDQDERLVSVNGRGVRVKTAGLQHARSGVPAVVFETGLQSPLEAWLTVPVDVAGFAPVVFYDRAGLGQSEPDGQLAMPSHAGRNLHALLAQIGVKPPYVLVGHSYGGLLIRAFAALYRREVAGLVYVDPTDARSEAQSMEYYRARGYTEEDVPQVKTQLAQRFKALPGTEMAAALELERTNFAEILALPPAPDVPVSVLMAIKYDPSPWAADPCTPRDCYDSWVRLRTGWLMPLVQASSDGTLMISTSSSHNMQRDDPALVVSAIRRVVTAATKRK